MIKRPFFGLAKPKLKYPVVENHGQDPIKEMPLPRKAVFFLKHSGVRSDDLILKVGDKVRTGQKLRLAEESKGYLISTVTGIITGISEHTGYLGQTYPAISIDAAGEDQWDDEFKGSDKTPNHENALEFLNCLPGHPDLSCLMNYQTPVNTIIINGIDKELLITTNQIIVKTQIESLIEGLKHLKKINCANLPQYIYVRRTQRKFALVYLGLTDSTQVSERDAPTWLDRWGEKGLRAENISRNKTCYLKFLIYIVRNVL